ncbi:MAG: CPBP family intramembrane glutamic endopeptidase [Nocardioidaceae bacterium]
MSTSKGTPSRSPGAADLMPAGQTRLKWEIAIVLGLSLGQSAVYSVISLVAKLSEPGDLSSQTATLNPSVSPRPLLDLTYQLVGIGFAIVPVVLVVFLLSAEGLSATRRLGLDIIDRRTAMTDWAWGAGLAAVIGLPGLGLYYVAKSLNLNATVIPSGLTEYWWTLPVLILAAAQNAVLEEVVVVGYLITRLRQLGVGDWPALVSSAVLRGSYHLYQGFGAFVGNAVMGVVFGYFYQRKGRVLPLVIAHALIDIVAFIGYALFKDQLSL